MTLSEEKKMKYCSKCEKVKELNGGFYKAGKSWQKLCKICHNERRIEYAQNNIYKPKPVGFKKLPDELLEAYGLDGEDYLKYTIKAEK